MGTNTKMYKTIAQTNQFIGRLSELTADIDRSEWELFVIPSFTTLDSANQHRDKNLVKLGAQNMGVEVIIAGGMGGGAVDIFNERRIEVIVGVEGDARAAVESYLRGELESTGSVCHEHAYENECGGHHAEKDS